MVEFRAGEGAGDGGGWLRHREKLSRCIISAITIINRQQFFLKNKNYGIIFLFTTKIKPKKPERKGRSPLPSPRLIFHSIRLPSVHWTLHPSSTLPLCSWVWGRLRRGISSEVRFWISPTPPLPGFRFSCAVPSMCFFFSNYWFLMMRESVCLCDFMHKFPFFRFDDMFGWTFHLFMRNREIFDFLFFFWCSIKHVNALFMHDVLALSLLVLSLINSETLVP